MPCYTMHVCMRTCEEDNKRGGGFVGKHWIRVFTLQTIIVGVVVACCIRFLPQTVVIPRIDFILNSLMTCASTFSGFTLTIVSILLSFSRSPVMLYLSKHGGTDELRLRYTLSVVIGVVLIIVILVIGSLVNEKNEIGKVTLTVGISATIAYFYNLVTSGWYLLRTLARATTPQSGRIDETLSSPKGKYRVS